MNTATTQPCFVFSLTVRPTIAPVIETCLHFARLAEVAAIAGVQPESVQYTIAHITSMLDDISGTEKAEDHAIEVSALCEYAENALNAAHSRADCHEEIHMMIDALVSLQERVERFARYDDMGAEMATNDPLAYIAFSAELDGGAV